MGICSSTEARTESTESPMPMESTQHPVFCDKKYTMRNWGSNITPVQVIAFYPVTYYGIQECVKWAKGKRIRTTGYRHTWASQYPAEGDVLISTIPLNEADDLWPHTFQWDSKVETQEIKQISPNLVKIGCGVTNEHFREYVDSCIEKGIVPTVLPYNVFMVETTIAGASSNMCHGAGGGTSTLSDIIEEMEIVNALGERVVIKDPKELQATAGSFGVFGVICNITFRGAPLEYAILKPTKRPVGTAIPPPPTSMLDEKLVQHIFNKAYDTKYASKEEIMRSTEYTDARNEFHKRCKHYYAEWFWFVFHPQVWINTWELGGNASEYKRPFIKPETQGWDDFLETIGEISNHFIFTTTPKLYQALIVSKIAMWDLPDWDAKTPRVVAPITEAMHLRRGVQQMRIKDMEWEIPIPRLDGPDADFNWDVCAEAWWRGIVWIYNHYNESGQVPVNLVLEMRIMGGSKTFLAAQNGNQRTCAIEILSTNNTSEPDFLVAKQGISDQWAAVNATTSENRMRPHWAKQWTGVTVRGQNVEDYVQRVCSEQIRDFNAKFEELMKRWQISSDSGRKRFFNDSIALLLHPKAEADLRHSPLPPAPPAQFKHYKRLQVKQPMSNDERDRIVHYIDRSIQQLQVEQKSIQSMLDSGRAEQYPITMSVANPSQLVSIVAPPQPDPSARTAVPLKAFAMVPHSTGVQEKVKKQLKASIRLKKALNEIKNDINDLTSKKSLHILKPDLDDEKFLDPDLDDEKTV